MWLFDSLWRAAVPGPHNSYRPRLLGKEALSFFLAVVITAEAFFGASLWSVNPSQTFLAAAGAAPIYTPSPVQGEQSALRTFSRSLSDPQIAAALALGAVIVILGALLILTIFMHVHIQPTDMLLPGAAVVALAALCLWCNVYLASPPGDNGLAAPGPAQYHW